MPELTIPTDGLTDKLQLKSYCTTKYFHGVSADTDIGRTIAFKCGSYVNFTGTPRFASLPNNDLLVGFRHSMSHHPTGSTTGRRARCRILAIVKDHSGSDLESVLMTLRINKIKKTRTGGFE